MIGLMGFLFWKASGSQIKITEFVRDDQGRVIKIIEK